MVGVNLPGSATAHPMLAVADTGTEICVAGTDICQLELSDT